MQLWSINDKSIIKLQKKNLDLEKKLEDWIGNDPSLLGLDICIIGRQVRTEFGGIVDLLGIEPDGKIVVIELKRDKTPRDIVAQILDYASWVKDLGFDKLNLICKEYSKKDIRDCFRSHYDEDIPDEINTDHSMIIVATEVDAATERIIQYLQDRHDVAINAIFFNLFNVNGGDVIGRSWLSDPVVVSAKERKTSVPWGGLLYVNTGINDENYLKRVWKFNLLYNYISAGGGHRWITAIKKLQPGDRFFAYVKGHGYVGYGEVVTEAVPIKDYLVDGKPVLELLPKDHEFMDNASDIERCEWLARVKWIKTFSQEEAKSFKNIFASQHVVCKLRDPDSVKFLSKEFGLD